MSTTNSIDLDSKLARKNKRFNTEELLRIQNRTLYEECLGEAADDGDREQCTEEYPEAAKEDTQKEKAPQSQDTQLPKDATKNAKSENLQATPTPPAPPSFLQQLRSLFNKPVPQTTADILNIVLGQKNNFKIDTNDTLLKKRIDSLQDVFEKLSEKCSYDIEKWDESKVKVYLLKWVGKYNIETDERAKVFLHQLILEYIREEATLLEQELTLAFTEKQKSKESVVRETAKLKSELKREKDLHNKRLESIRTMLKKDKAADVHREAAPNDNAAADDA